MTAPDVPFPGGPYGLAGAAGREVVFWAKGGGFKLWDPATRRTVRTVRDGYYGSGDEDHLTWCRAADFGVLHLLELRSGRQSLVRPPAGFRAMECPAGVLSPDGEVLAVPVSRAKLGQFGDYGEPLSLALTDTITGRARVVPGSTVPAGYVYLAWASDGRTVFMSGGDRRRVIVAYTLDNERARRLPLQLGRFSIYGMAAS